jgi:hypothetical protein
MWTTITTATHEVSLAYAMHVQYFLHLLLCTHQEDIQFHIKRLTNCLPWPVGSCGWCPRYFKRNHMLFSDTTDNHHTATIMWKLSWTVSCLSYGLAMQGSTTRPLQSPDDPSLTFFSAGLWKTEQHLLQCVWQEIKCHLDVCSTTNIGHVGMKNIFPCSLHQCVFNLCGYYFLTNKLL